jgi:hypothetical protein
VIVQQMRHMLASAREEVVEADDLVTIVEEALAEMRSDETCSACNQNSHRNSSLQTDADSIRRHG